MAGIARFISKRLKIARFWRSQKSTTGFCFIHINKCGGTSVEAFFDLPKIHDSAAQRIKKIGRSRWDNNFTFAVVRNPYARVISHYKYRLKTNQTKLKEKPLSLNQWIHAAYGEKDPKYYNKPLMFAPCFEWLSVEGEIVINKWIKLEEISSNWQEICASVGVDFEPLSNKNKTSNNTVDEAIAKLDERSIAIINRHFSIDFATFGYDKF